MNASTSYFPRNPKFTDSFERDLANDDARHIGRDEPSTIVPVIVKAFEALVRAVHFLRASAQQPKMDIRAN